MQRTGSADDRSRPVDSDQPGPHPRLPGLLARHRACASRRPWPAHATTALAPLVTRMVQHGGALVLDLGCGTGDSTAALARHHAPALVVGVDKSAARLARAPALPANALLLRARVEDVWRLAREHAWPVTAQYLFYPNPWPKQRHLMRRWHAHPALADLVALGGRVELRTNWRVYAEEFAAALAWWCELALIAERWQPACGASAFERKYLASGLPLYRVVANLPRPSGA